MRRTLILLTLLASPACDESEAATPAEMTCAEWLTCYEACGPYSSDGEYCWCGHAEHLPEGTWSVREADSLAQGEIVKGDHEGAVMFLLEGMEARAICASDA